MIMIESKYRWQGGMKMDSAAFIWFVLMVVFLVAEGICPFHLISVWFAVGALAAVVVSLLGGAAWLQITVFLVVSAGLLLALWPVSKKIQLKTCKTCSLIQQRKMIINVVICLVSGRV